MNLDPKSHCIIACFIKTATGITVSEVAVPKNAARCGMFTSIISRVKYECSLNSSINLSCQHSLTINVLISCR